MVPALEVAPQQRGLRHPLGPQPWYAQQLPERRRAHAGFEFDLVKRVVRALGQTLAPATARGQLVGVKIDGRLYCPRGFLSMDRADVGAICRALADVGDSEKLMFWLRGHGALAGRSVAAAMDAGTPTAKVTRLAEAWAREREGTGGFKGDDMVKGPGRRS